MRLHIAAIVCTILIGFISLDISSSLVSKSLAQETHKHENKKQSETGRKAPIDITDEELDKLGVPDNWAYTLPYKTTTNADPEGRVFNVEIKNRKVSKELSVIRVKQGDQVTLKWTTDEPAKIHLHGYSIEKEVKPGETTLLTFKAYATGRFSITNHGFGGQRHDAHKQSHEGHGGETPLLYLEVLP